MDERIKEEWIRRLESGNYKQGEGYLKRRGSDGEVRYCCLGVLMEMAAEEGVITSVEDGGRWYFDSDGVGLTRKVMEWAGIEGNRGGLVATEPEGMLPLSDFNDNKDYGFNMIAQVIREKL